MKLFDYNPGHSITKLCKILAWVSFATSKLELGVQYNKLHTRFATRVVDQKLRNLGKCRNKQISKISGLVYHNLISLHQQPSRGVLRKTCSENMQQIYGRTPMLKCDFNKVALHGCSPVNLLHIFGAPFPKNTSGRLLLHVAITITVDLLCQLHSTNTQEHLSKYT